MKLIITDTNGFRIRNGESNSQPSCIDVNESNNSRMIGDDAGYYVMVLSLVESLITQRKSEKFIYWDHRMHYWAATNKIKRG